MSLSFHKHRSILRGSEVAPQIQMYIARPIVGSDSALGSVAQTQLDQVRCNAGLTTGMLKAY